MSPNQKIILITGGSGRIGTRVIERFHGSGYHLIGLNITPPRHQSDDFSYIKTDISSDESVQSALQEIRTRFGKHISSVLHLGAYYNFQGGHWDQYEQVTIQGTERLLRELQQFEVEQFIFASTVLVHAPADPPQKITENSPILGAWEYPESKIRAEKVIREQHGSIPIVILRIAGCYDDECHCIPISNQIQRIYENQFASHVFPGNLSHGNTFLHLNDLAEVFFTLVQKRHELPKNLTFLVGEDETLSYEELQEQISQLIRGKKIHTYYVPKWFAKLGTWILDKMTENAFVKPWMIEIADNHYDLDNSHIKKVLGWQPKYRLSQTMPKMIEFLKKDPLHWYAINDLYPPKWLKHSSRLKK